MIIRPATNAFPQRQTTLLPLKNPDLRPQLQPLPHSPTQRIVQQSPSLISRPSSEYMLHLVPNNAKMSNCSVQPSVRYPQHSSSAIHFVHDNKSNKSNSLYKSGQDAMKIKMESTATKSIDLSEASNQKSQLQQAHKQAYFCPPSPQHLRRIEPIRRVSQQNAKISPRSEEKSSNSQSQPNINITIQSNIPINSKQLPPKITVSHIQHSPVKKQTVSTLQTPPQIIQRHIITHPTHIIQQKSLVKVGPLIRQPSLSNKFHLISIGNKQERKQYQKPSENEAIYARKHSLSMDSKKILRPMTYNSNQTSSSGFKYPSNIIPNQPSQIQAQQPVSFNVHSQQSNLRKQQIQQHNQVDLVKESELKEHHKSKISIQQQTIYHNQRVNSQQQAFKGTNYHEVYDEYYQQAQVDPQPSLRKQTNSNYAYLYTQRMSSNSRILINEIFQNETNKALLKMRSLQRSRERSLKRTKF